MASLTFGRMGSDEIDPLFGPDKSSPVLAIAHQGGNLERPDETMESFRNGRNTGSDVLEFDVHLSADGHLIVIHDIRVDRTTNGRGRINEMNLPEIEILDAGYWWPYHSNDDVAKAKVPEDQNFPWRGKGLNLLTLNEMLSEFPDIPLNIEVKSGGAKAALQTYRVLKEAERLGDVLVVSSDTEILKAYREYAPDSPTGAHRGEVTRFWILGKLGLGGLANVKATALQVPITQGKLKIITPAFIRRAHRNGLAVHAWTINDEEEMVQLIEIGIDGIITDLPTTLASLDRSK